MPDSRTHEAPLLDRACLREETSFSERVGRAVKETRAKVRVKDELMIDGQRDLIA
jgi:hypothetical protein